MYVVIKQKHWTVAQLVKILSKMGVLEYHIIIIATTSNPAPLQFLAPYSNCVVGNIFKVMECTH